MARLKPEVTNYTSSQINYVPLKEQIRLQFNVAIDTFYLQRLRLLPTEDSTKRLQVKQLKQEDPRVLELEASLSQGQSYRLMLLPGCVQYFDSLNTDTLQFQLKKDVPESYGSIIIDFDTNQVERTQLLQVMNQHKRLVFESYLKDVPVPLKLNMLREGTYSFKILYDINGNRRWDTGDFRTKKQPEKIVQFSQKANLKGNWEAEIRLDLNQ
jgi:hypothetical protein